MTDEAAALMRVFCDAARTNATESNRAGVQAVAAEVRRRDAAPTPKPKEAWEVAREAWRTAPDDRGDDCVWRAVADALTKHAAEPKPKSAGTVLFQVMHPDSIQDVFVIWEERAAEFLRRMGH